MAIVKKYDPKNIYISDRLQKCLNTIIDNPLTIAEAPTGYGKSTTIREHLKNNNIPFIWFNIDSDDKERFFTDFCDRIKTVSEESARKMMAVGYPTSSQSCTKIAQALMEIEFREPTVLVLDNYNLISDEYTNEVINDVSGNTTSNLRLVVLTHAITSKLTLELVLKKKLNCINKEDFELSKAEIFEYYKACGIKLEDEETQFLYQYTEGWISALYLQMLSYVATNKFEPTASIDNLVCKAIWDNLNSKEQDFLISMSVFDSFTIRQALYIDSEITEEEILALVSKSGFIKYDPKTRKYYIHALLIYFLETEFEKLEAVFKRKMLKSAGDWCKVNESYFDAICYYYRIKDYESILNMNYSLDIFNGINYKSHKNMILDIIEKTPYDVKAKYLNTFMVFVFFLFIYNKRDVLSAECDTIQEILDTHEYPKALRNNIEGNLYCLRGVRNYNDIDLMYEKYDKAYELLKKPIGIFAAMGSCTFNCPSVVSMYHKELGKLDEEIKKMDHFMPLYYKLTDGSGKGQEAMMRAEALFLRGNFADAEKLCNKAIYMAETRNEMSIYICAQLVLGRIAFFQADYPKLNTILENITKKVETTERFDLVPMSDMCIGYIKILMEEEADIPGWLCNNETIEDNCIIQNLGFANLIYGKYLLHTGQYELFESIAGQMQSIAGVFDNYIYKIYICIYLSIAKIARKDNDMAKRLLREAVEYAKADGIIIPFVENINEISIVISELGTEAENRDFINEIKQYAKKYTKSVKSVKKASKNEHSYGLTNREVEVAKLAAQRLSNKEIADTLFIAESTVKSNLKVIFSKLDISSRNELKNYF